MFTYIRNISAKQILAKYLLFCLVITSILSWSQTTNVPDVSFEDYLEMHDADGNEVSVGDNTSMGDGILNNALVSTDRIDFVTSLNIVGLDIQSLVGIEDFSSLEILVVNNNRLEEIDVSSNNSLRILNVSDNRIAGELDVSSNPDLEGLFCSSNQISVLNLNNNQVLRDLSVRSNFLTTLDLSTINTTVCPDPQTEPTTPCQGGGLIDVSENQLISLTISNGFNELFNSFIATDNPDLFCIKIDPAFNPPANWQKDDWAYYTDGVCVDIFTYVPDDNFEQALIDQGLDTELDNLVLTENINVLTSLDVSNQSIADLTGIEDFSVLTTLNAGSNSIETIYLSENGSLTVLDLSNNELTELNLNSNLSLSSLFCESNFIENLDISSLASLQILNCSSNALTELNTTSNLQLADLDGSFNQIERLDLSLNPALISLLCNDNNLFALNLGNGNNNNITIFDATNNPDLSCIEVDNVAFANSAAGWQKDAIANYNLDCGTYVPDDNFEQALIDLGIDSDNTLNNFVPTVDIINYNMPLDVSGLDISDLTGIEDFSSLQNLDCSNNNLAALDILANTALVSLNCAFNQIETLDLTTNTALTNLLCNNNALQSLNVENGTNTDLTAFNATNNPSLFCINVDDAIVGNIPPAWQKDTFAIYNGDCDNNRFTIIPDTFFEQALIELGVDTLLDGQVFTTNIEQLQTLEVSNKSISDLTGIRDFKSLIELDCSGNFLDELDVSNLVFLERLNCGSNYLLTNNPVNAEGVLNISNTPNLKELFCINNSLSDLDTSTNLNLELLDCADNDLTSLIISGNSLLRSLNCSNNALENLDISQNVILELVNCDSNELQNLITDTNSNINLVELSCADNQLTNLSISNYQALSRLNCSVNQLTALDVQANPDLRFLSASVNEITSINLANNALLEELLISQNTLNDLNISANTNLNRLNCNFNEITTLDVSTNSIFERLSCTNNQLANLDLSGNVNLIELDCSANSITNLNIASDLSLLKSLNISNNQIEGDLNLTTLAISACTFELNQEVFCPETISVNLSNNNLEFVNLQNGINSEIESFNASGNPNLECIQVDDIDNVPANWITDAETSYNVDCNFGETFIPDDNFEQRLIDLGLDSGPLNDYVFTSAIENLTDLDLSGNAIADLTGIEDFVALENLNCSSNNLSALDVSFNTNLQMLDCSANTISELLLENNISLTGLNCAGNDISILDLSANENLIELDVSDNNFNLFLPAEVPSLQILNIANNGLLALDFQQNQNLVEIYCQANQLEILNIRNGQNSILSELNAQNNPDLECIETDTGVIPTGVNWLIDPTAEISEECNFGETFVPDDSFEEALIDLGYDSGEPDDYVLTENIAEVTFLNVSGYEISDLTGIEDFISLSSLNVSENEISTLDVSNNLLLANIIAANNAIGTIDVSGLSALLNLNLANNNVQQLDLSTNLAITDLDIGNNQLTEIIVSNLANLEDFNCGVNQIESLDLSQNSNLSLLFCQNNALFGDQLNLQNGNNENLLVLNATNNPALGCILVDNPVAVINNTEGFYDNWLKDDSASYQVICDDADNDGIPNVDDLCPGTEFGATVDLFGCAVPDFATDNFTVTVTDETCLNSNDGKVTIVAQELLFYTATLTRENFTQSYNFTNDVDIFNLLAGTYQMCITVEEWPDYETCYTIVIESPNPLEVFELSSDLDDVLNLNLSGANLYNINFNGREYATQNSSLALNLKLGLNTISISTELPCQGRFEKSIYIGDEALVYPNPFGQTINILMPPKFNVMLERDNFGNVKQQINVAIYSALGRLVLSKAILKSENPQIAIDSSSLPAGIYMISISSGTETSVHKIIKQ
ncbi:MAG: T9SS type A sorting domain-containing protein [Bacteroidota bacterium]